MNAEHGTRMETPPHAAPAAIFPADHVTTWCCSGTKINQRELRIAASSHPVGSPVLHDAKPSHRRSALIYQFTELHIEAEHRTDENPGCTSSGRDGASS